MGTENKGNIAIACDHAGFELKQAILNHLVDSRYLIVDLGTNSTSSVDYPDFADELARVIRDGEADRGVLVCGSGIGISIAANRHHNIRAALIHDVYSARLSRMHNDANVIAFGGRLISETVAFECLRVFLNTEFEGGRHSARVDKLRRCSST